MTKQNSDGRLRQRVNISLDPGQVELLSQVTEKLGLRYDSTTVGACVLAGALLLKGDPTGALRALQDAEDAPQGARPRGGGGKRWEAPADGHDEGSLKSSPKPGGRKKSEGRSK